MAPMAEGSVVGGRIRGRCPLLAALAVVVAGAVVDGGGRSVTIIPRPLHATTAWPPASFASMAARPRRFPSSSSSSASVAPRGRPSPLAAGCGIASGAGTRTGRRTTAGLTMSGTRVTRSKVAARATATATAKVFGRRVRSGKFCGCPVVVGGGGGASRHRWRPGGVVGRTSTSSTSTELPSTAPSASQGGEEEGGDDDSSLALTPPLAEEGDWAAYVDREGTGQVYYFNGLTGESSWDPPTDTFPPVSVPPPISTKEGSNGTPLYSRILDAVDGMFVGRAVSLANHVPAMASLLYFGLIAMITGGGPTTSFSATAASSSKATAAAGKGAAAAAPMVATLRAALTGQVGPTTNKAFSSYFPTLVTPANFVFLIWPVIAALQFLTVSVSAAAAFFASDESREEESSSGGGDGGGGGAVLSQSDLSSLAVANLFATGWLIASSRAVADSPVPILSSVLLPFVPLFGGYPLRRRARAGGDGGLKLLVYRVYTSFTVIASILALAVELQHGGRVPRLAGRPVPAALAFLGCASFVVNLGGLGLVQSAVNVLALGGIAWRGARDAVAAGAFSDALGAVRGFGGTVDYGTLGVLALTVACSLNAVWKLFSPGRRDAEHGS